MGYYFDCVAEFEITDMKRFKEIVLSEKEKQENYFFDNISEYSFESGYLDLEDINLKYNEKEFNDFCDALAKCGKGFLMCCGEDTGKWRIKIEEGKWEDQIGSVFYGFDAYETFMKEYGELIPKKIKSDLEKWNVARKI